MDANLDIKLVFQLIRSTCVMKKPHAKKIIKGHYKLAFLTALDSHIFMLLDSNHNFKYLQGSNKMRAIVPKMIRERLICYKSTHL
jgi:hypothetical protein